MLLDFPLKLGKNYREVPLLVNLNLVRKFHQIAEFEAQMLIDLDEDLSCYQENFTLNLYIEYLVELGNLREQIKQVKKMHIKEVHINNLLFIILICAKTDKQLIIKQDATYSRLLKHLQSIRKIKNAIADKNLFKLEVDIILKRNIKGVKLTFAEGLPKAVLVSMLNPLYDELATEYFEIIREIHGKPFTRETLPELDLKKTEDYLVLLNLNKSDKSFKEHLMRKLLLYIRTNHVLDGLSDLSAKNYPTAKEARLIYVLLVLTSNHSILSENDKKGRLFPEQGANHMNYNAEIISHIVKIFKDFEKRSRKLASLQHTPSSITNMFELFLPFNF